MSRFLGGGAIVDGSFRGRLKSLAMRPETSKSIGRKTNTLLSASAIDTDSMKPDDNAVVTLSAGMT